MTTKGARRWNEAKFTKWFCRCIEKNNGMTHAIVGNAMSRGGWPDRYIAHIKWSGFIEFKAGDNRLSEIQQKILKGLKARGVNVFVVVFRNKDFFEFRHVNGKILASFDLLPWIGREAEAGKMLLDTMVRINDMKTFKESPIMR